MRLYRGLKEPYRPERVVANHGSKLVATDFTDCPFMALAYARARRGVVLVLDVPAGVHVREELWLENRARRLMLWGKFDRFVVAEVPAKVLRSRVHAKGVGAQPDEYKSSVLRRAIDEILATADRRDRSATGG